MTTNRFRVVGVVSVALLASLGSGCREEGAAEELDTAMFDRGASSSVEVLQALAVSDALFAFDPTLDPSASVEVNAMAIASHVEGHGCASAEVSGSSVTVTFASGCMLRIGLTASGSVSAEIARSAAGLEVVLDFDALVVGSHTLEGTATFTTRNGSTLDVQLALVASAGSASAELTVVGSAGAMQIDGTTTGSRDGTTTSLAFTAVVWRTGDCYPSAGSMTVASGRVMQTVAFTSATPSTGTVTITQGRVSRQATLPSYGTCPMGA